MGWVAGGPAVPCEKAVHENDSITRLIPGCFRFFTLTQSFDRPARYGRSTRFDTMALKSHITDGAEGRDRFRVARIERRRCRPAGGRAGVRDWSFARITAANQLLAIERQDVEG